MISNSTPFRAPGSLSLCQSKVSNGQMPKPHKVTTSLSSNVSIRKKSQEFQVSLTWAWKTKLVNVMVISLLIDGRIRLRNICTTEVPKKWYKLTTSRILIYKNRTLNVSSLLWTDAPNENIWCALLYNN